MKSKTKRRLQGAHRDRVSQVYFGTLDWGASGAILRQRIDWIAGQTRGPRVLDVGCSEGVIEILLAREGFHVTGVDIDAEALDFARNLLAQEPEEVRDRISFVQGDLARARLLEEQFDTLVMGEVLEHLEHPEVLLDRSLEHIRPGGRVIVTTPFGYHPDEDHRQTFCLSDFIALVKPRCALEHLEVESGYVRMVGRVSPSTESSWQQLDSGRLLTMTEAAAVASQRYLYGNIGGHKKRVSALERQLQERTDNSIRFQKNFEEERSNTDKLRREIGRERARASALKEEAEQSQAKAVEQYRQAEEERARTATLKRETQKARARADELEQEVERSRVEAAGLQRQIEEERAGAATLRREIEKASAKADELEQELEQRQAEAAGLQRQIEEERTGAATLKREVEKARAKADELEQEIERSQAKVAGLQQQIEEERTEAATLKREVEKASAKAVKLEREIEQGNARAALLQREVQAGKTKATKLQQAVREAGEREAQLRRSIRWQVGCLFVGAAHRPWRAIRLPLDLARLFLVAVRRRHRSAAVAGSTRNPSRPSPANPGGRGNECAAPAHSGGRRGAPKATISSAVAPSHDHTIDWVVDRVEGQRVAVIGCDNGALLDLLAQLRFEVDAYRYDAAGLEPVTARGERPADSQERAGLSLTKDNCAPEDNVATGALGKADTVIMWEMPGGQAESEAFLKCVRDRLSRPQTKVVIVQPRLGAFPQDGTESGLTLLLAALRASTVPEYLSLANDDLRFVGRFNRSGKKAWSQFEAEAWPRLTSEVAKSLRSRQHRETAALEQRLQDVLESTSFKAGQVLVAAAQERRTLWKVPFRLWRLYRASAALKRPRNVTPPSSPIAPALSFPALKLPAPWSAGTPVVAAILDTFTEYCLRYEADLVLLSPKHWKRQLMRTQPAFLLVESSWAGNNGAWRYMLTNYKTREINPLRELVAFCQEQGIRTVFWNKEDPPNFDVFIDVAKDFDIVFTTDAACIPKYKQICGHDRVFLMAFASQPRIHNPCREKSWPRHAVCFAGSWMEKYSNRKQSLHDLLGPALTFGLHIFDRNFKASGSDSRYRFPERYRGAIKGSLDYERMLTAYRCYDVMMNVNTVTDSPTMFSRRVFESLACATPVISTDSAGLRAVLGSHVRITRSPQDTCAHLQELLGDEEKRMREGHLGYRHVHEHHTYRHRMEEVFRRVGVRPAMFPRRPSVSVIVATCRPENVTSAISNYAKQDYEERELLLLLNNAEFDVSSIEAQAGGLANVRIVEIEGRPSLGECLNRGVEEASGDYVAKMDDDDHYGERYLSDMMLAANFTEAEILGKGTYFVHVEGKAVMALRSVSGQHQFTEFVSGATLTARREVLREIRFPDRTRGEDSSLLAEASKAGCRIYSADPFNILVIRGMDNRRHTWDIDDSEFLKNCRNIRPGLEWDRVMI